MDNANENNPYKLRIELAGASEEIDVLKAKLAESEKEIEKLKHYNDRLAQGIYHSYGEHFILKIKQDKIKFAIDELNKLLEKVKPLDVMVRTGHYINQKKVNVVFEEDIKRKIEELKDKTNDKI